ncbi:hypothetical protein [Streptomyces sp. KL116D]|uniref:hypothetical protein n=1 Tax=Streptomyces sp. KL116D TaxID=3045152 RepID=UPI003556EF11
MSFVLGRRSGARVVVVESLALGPEVARSVMSRAIRAALVSAPPADGVQGRPWIGAGPPLTPESASAMSPVASHRVASP